MQKNQKGIAHIGMIVLVVVLVVIGVAGWFVWSKNKVTDEEPKIETAQPATKTDTTKQPDQPTSSTATTQASRFEFKELGISMQLEDGWTATLQPTADSQEDPNIKPVSYVVTKPGITAYIEAYRNSIAAGFPGCASDDEMVESVVVDKADTGISDIAVYNSSMLGMSLVKKSAQFGSRTKSLSASQINISDHKIGDKYFYCQGATAPLGWTANFDNNDRSIDGVWATDKSITNTMAVPKSTKGYDEIFKMLQSVKRL